MLSIHRASVQDIPLIQELTYQVWPQTYTPILGKIQVNYMLELMYNDNALKIQMEEQGQHYLIAYDVKQPVGFASWTEMNAGIFKLNKLYVLPGLQGRGVGRFLIQAVLTDIRSLSATMLYLNVNRYNAAKHFYERLGFELEREEDIDIGNGYFMNDYVMKYKV